MRYKLWDVINECWYDRGDIYLDEDGHLFCIEEITRGYETYMNKENVNARYELVRWTGLKDRNGKDIYEGDILECDFPVEIMDNGCHSIDGETIIMRVSFVQGCWIAKGKAVNYEFLLPLDEINLYELFETKAYGKYPVKISVIGNTFENMNLLEATP